MDADAGAGALIDHLTRAWDMVLEAVRAMPDEEWRVASLDRMQPARVVYHLLIASSRYTWSGPADDYLSRRRFNLDWLNAPADAFPDRESALRHLEQAKADSLAWVERLGSNGLVAEEAKWPWTGDSALAQGLYHLRHLQHHMAELNVELRRRGLKTVEWK
jgi:hypothetical protein